MLVKSNDRSKFKLKEVSDYQKWNCFVEESPQGTIFSNFDYLSVAVSKFKLFWIYKGNYPCAGVVVILDKDEASCILDDFVIYGGILFNQDSNKKITKLRHERFEITEYVINQLDNTYKNIELALSPQFEDMRPFLWHNYHPNNSADKFTVSLRYTSYLDISELKDKEDSLMFKNLDTLRQRNIREALTENASVSQEIQTELFIDFYIQLMNKQGIDTPVDKQKRMKDIVNYLIKNNKATMVVCRNSTNEIIYIVVFCFDTKRAYYLFGAGNPASTERYKGTFCFWKAFKILANHYGITTIDMEGINSPNRGWFKLSFGGSIAPYYQIRLSKNIRRL